MKKFFDVIIIGAGPAGMTAGIYAVRAGLKAVMFERSSPGGQIIRTHEVENYPATGTVSGVDLAMNMHAQCESLGVLTEYEEIISASLEGTEKSVKTVNGAEYTAPAVIICTGAEPRKLEVPGEDKYTGRGVSYCAACDGAFYKGKAVAVIGGGNTAVEDALYLTRFAAKVYLIHRRQGFRAAQILLDKLYSDGKIELVLDSVVSSINGGGKVNSAVIKNVSDNKVKEIALDGIFVAVGQIPINNLCRGIAMDDGGYIVTDEKMRTSAAGVFAAGDVRNKPLRQVVTACSDGATAAMSVNEYLMKI